MNRNNVFLCDHSAVFFRKVDYVFLWNQEMQQFCICFKTETMTHTGLFATVLKLLHHKPKKIKIIFSDYIYERNYIINILL